MYKKYNDLINKTNRFLRSYNKEPIAAAFAQKGMGQTVIDSGQAKSAAVSETLGERELKEVAYRKALDERRAFLSEMKRESGAFERAVAKVFPTDADKRKYGFVTRYANEEQEPESETDSSGGEPRDIEPGETSQVGNSPDQGGAETGETVTVRVAQRRSESESSIMGRQRQVAVGIAAMTQEAKDRMAEYGWTEERLTILSGMGQVYESLCRTTEDRKGERRMLTLELDRRYRALRSWYRNLSQTARDLAKTYDHLAPELNLMGERLVA